MTMLTISYIENSVIRALPSSLPISQTLQQQESLLGRMLDKELVVWEEDKLIDIRSST